MARHNEIFKINGNGKWRNKKTEEKKEVAIDRLNPIPQEGEKTYQQ